MYFKFNYIIIALCIFLLKIHSFVDTVFHFPVTITHDPETLKYFNM